jgi:GT2 family glycosyltransferase
VEEKAEPQVRAEPSISPGLAICILNWNGWRDTLECVESLRKQDYANFATVVLDNHSRNDSAERIRAWAKTNLPEPSGFVDYQGNVARQGGEECKESLLEGVKSPDRLVLICNEDNTGFTGGCNVVIDYALHRKFPQDYVFLLNNDARLEPDCLTHLMAVAKESGAGIIGAVMFDESGKEPIFNGRISMKRQFFYPLVNWQLAPPATDKDFWPSDCVHGGAIVIRADVLRAVRAATGNYLHEGLFMYNECAEFQYHAACLGHHAVVAKNARVYHKNARSSGGTENPIAYYYTERSRLLVANVVLPFGWKVMFHLVNIPLVSARILKNVIRRKRVAAQAILEGLVDGYRGREGKWRHHDQRLRKGL